MSLDIHQRVSLGILLVALAYFLAHTAYKTPKPAVGSNAPVTPSQHGSGDATTSGPKSPAVTGNGDNVTYNQPSPPEKKAEPPKKE